MTENETPELATELAEDKLTYDQFLGLAAMAVAVLVIANDFTSLSVALPGIEKSLGADVTTVQWVITGYALTFGVLIVSGGRLADILGRRKVFFIGSVIFGLSSLAGGFAEAAWQLIVARLIMGVGGALMWPAILGMTFALTPASRMGIAGGLIMSACGVGNSIGPLLGGMLTDTIGWRWIFFVNVPVALTAMAITWRVVPADEIDGPDEKIDYPGVVVLSLALLALLIALDVGTDLGWFSPPILGLFGAFLVGAAIFYRVESKGGNTALLPADVMDNKEFLAAGLATLTMSAIFFAALLYLPQFMTKQLGYSALQSGVGMLPMMLTFALTSFVSAPLYGLLGAKLVLILGSIALAAGMFLLSALTAETTFMQLIPGMMVLGVGTGLFYSSITTFGMAAVDESRASLAGGIIYMFQIAGGSIGLGLNTAIVVSMSSLAEGIRYAFIVNGGLALAGLCIVLFYVHSDKEIHLLSKLHRHKAHG